MRTCFSLFSLGTSHHFANTDGYRLRETDPIRQLWYLTAGLSAWIGRKTVDMLSQLT